MTATVPSYPGAPDVDDEAPARIDEDASPQRTVLGRVATILDAFNDELRILSLGELSRRTGLPKSTLHRLTEQMCGVGWLIRAPGGYRIGIGLFEVGTLAIEGTRMNAAAFPHLQALVAKTGMAAQFAILEGAQIVYVDRIAAPTFRLPTRRGGRNPAHCTALGKALVAFTDGAVERVLDAPMERRTATTITDADRFRTEMEQVRDEGLAYDRGEALPGLVCIAAPVRLRGGAIAAVSLTSPSGGMRWAAAAEAVRSAAGAIWNATFTVNEARLRPQR